MHVHFNPVHFNPVALIRAASLVCATALATPALAGNAPAQSRMLQGIAPAPEVRQENGVEFLTGGVGIDGRAQLEPLVKDMNLQLVFAEKQSGAYLAEVEVVIANSQGEEVLNVRDSDPMVFAGLPPGTYSITAKSSRGTLERQVRVPDSGLRTELFLWS